MSAADLKKYDVVITTYQTVTKEHENSGGLAAAVGNKKRKTSDRALFEVDWKVGGCDRAERSLLICVCRQACHSR